MDRPRVIFVAALRSAAGRAPVWLFCWFGLFVAAAAVSAAWVGWFGGAADHNYAVGSLRTSLDETFRFDHRVALAALEEGTAQLASPIGLLMMLLGAFTAGGWLQIFLERTSGKSVRRFLWGGARYFGRFFRVWILTLVALALADWVCQGWVWKTLVLDILFGATEGKLEELGSERTAVWLGWAQAGIHAMFWALILAWGDYTRTRLALHNTRSAVWAGLCSAVLIVANPVKTLRPLVLIVAVEALILAALSIPAWSLNIGIDAESGAWTLILLFGVGQLAVMWRIISRGARYHATVSVSRILSPPVVPPDRWDNRVGGPGGPQYPIDNADDYGVSI